MLLIIGLDGADWRILDPWIEAGELPHLARLRAQGRHGNLRSTIRPESSTAWATFATGVNPGVHSIFGFVGQRPDTYETGLNTAAAIRASGFWQHAAAAGKRIALLNVPMTYPPQPLPGGMVIGGMLTPSLRSDFTYPAEVRQALLTAVPDYTINVERTGLNLSRFIDETARAIAGRSRAGLWLLREQSWDAAIVVFTATDRLQHYTLHLLDPAHPRHDPAEAQALTPALLTAYRAIDDAIGQLVDAAGPDATVILLSDHGFAACAQTFWPNVWLAERGLLKRDRTQSATPSPWQRLRGHAGLRKLKQRLPLLRDWRRPPATGAALAGIDWARTAAVYSPSGGIRLNVRGREPLGLLSPREADELATNLAGELMAWTDAATGVSPVLAVYPRAELYAGPWVDHAPDLIVEPRRAEAASIRNYVIRPGFAPAILTPSDDLTGNHTLDGILLAAGPGISAGDIAGARLLDMAPTLLYALGVPVPETMEGDVLPLWRQMAPAERVPATAHDHPAADALAAADEALLAERLRALGYL